jgi:hypothetical protein
MIWRDLNSVGETVEDVIVNSILRERWMSCAKKSFLAFERQET